ncbi:MULTISPECIES: hypothetical protein [Niastella]|uniref:Uncharacterized protein n=1 Tax=Niastella soli TaxID=2821487 RepID=A0ABS3Z543_9BACT|nr:hypothetical protein [Niastella soli]MBO9205282.1 hypothetical protein [Niastella soli]
MELIFAKEIKNRCLLVPKAENGLRDAENRLNRDRWDEWDFWERDVV